jgi:hypothetical protein
MPGGMLQRESVIYRMITTTCVLAAVQSFRDPGLRHCVKLAWWVKFSRTVDILTSAYDSGFRWLLECPCVSPTMPVLTDCNCGVVLCFIIMYSAGNVVMLSCVLQSACHQLLIQTQV